VSPRLCPFPPEPAPAQRPHPPACLFAYSFAFVHDIFSPLVRCLSSALPPIYFREVSSLFPLILAVFRHSLSLAFFFPSFPAALRNWVQVTWLSSPSFGPGPPCRTLPAAVSLSLSSKTPLRKKHDSTHSHYDVRFLLRTECPQVTVFFFDIGVMLSLPFFLELFRARLDLPTV